MSAAPTARRSLRLAAMAALQPLVTALQLTLESPPVTSTQPKQMPYAGVRCGLDRKSSPTKQGPRFTTSASLEVVARVSATSGAAAQDAIEALGAEIEAALFGYPPLIALVQQFANVTTTTEITAEGSAYQAGIEMAVDCELFENFDPVQINPGNYPALQGVGVHVDTVRPFDADGIYQDPPFPSAVTPAPRTAGPDGRDEGHIEVNLPE